MGHTHARTWSSYRRAHFINVRQVEQRLAQGKVTCRRCDVRNDYAAKEWLHRNPAHAVPCKWKCLTGHGTGGGAPPDPRISGSRHPRIPGSQDLTIARISGSHHLTISGPRVAMPGSPVWLWSGPGFGGSCRVVSLPRPCAAHLQKYVH